MNDISGMQKIPASFVLLILTSYVEDCSLLYLLSAGKQSVNYLELELILLGWEEAFCVKRSQYIL